jgi:dsDNA-binding SOS-regulon protein
LGSTANNLALSYLNVSDAGTTVMGVIGKYKNATESWRKATEKAEGASGKFGATLKHVGQGFKNLLKTDAADKFRKMFDPLNQLNNEMQRASDLAEKVQQNNQNLYRSTGQVSSGNFALGEQMKRLAMDTESVTIASGEMSKAQIALNESYMDFNSLSQDTINDLTMTNALLDQAGMSSRTSAENFEFFVKSMGMTAKEASKTNLKLLDLAQSMKQSPEAIGQAFKNSRNHLAAYGRDFVKHFSKMLGVSKKLGISVGKMLDVGAELDTFEGSAELAMRLNSVLKLRGEDVVSSQDLMDKTDDEKMVVLAKALQASPVDVAGGGSDVRGTIRSLAAGMGPLDMADVQRLATVPIDELRAEMKAQADLAKNSNKTAKDL